MGLRWKLASKPGTQPRAETLILRRFTLKLSVSAERCCVPGLERHTRDCVSNHLRLMVTGRKEQGYRIDLWTLFYFQESKFNSSDMNFFISSPKQLFGRCGTIVSQCGLRPRGVEAECNVWTKWSIVTSLQIAWLYWVIYSRLKHRKQQLL